MWYTAEWLQEVCRWFVCARANPQTQIDDEVWYTTGWLEAVHLSLQVLPSTMMRMCDRVWKGKMRRALLLGESKLVVDGIRKDWWHRLGRLWHHVTEHIQTQKNESYRWLSPWNRQTDLERSLMWIETWSVTSSLPWYLPWPPQCVASTATRTRTKIHTHNDENQKARLRRCPNSCPWSHSGEAHRLWRTRISLCLAIVKTNKMIEHD